MYKTILVPHAGTAGGDIALDHAIFAAKSSSSDIVLLHVVEEIQYPPSFALSSSEREKLFKDIRTANEEIKKEMISEMEKRMQICKENGVAARIRVVIGSASEEILQTIDKENVDLVVMAKRRKIKGLKGLLTLGSVSRKIVESTTCPVLLLDIAKEDD